MRTTNGFMSVESRRLPLVEVCYHRVSSGLRLIDDYRETFDEYGRLARRGEPMMYLIDMRQFDPLQITASMRREAAHISLLYHGRLLPVSVGEARVITSPLTRGIVTAFDWLTSANKWPCQQFASPTEGEAWLHQLLATWSTPARKQV